MRYEEHLALHGLVLKKQAGSEAVAAATGLPADRVAAVFANAVQFGRIAEFDGRYSLTPAGRMMVLGEYSRHYADLRSDSAFGAAYAGFERLNESLKSLITRWQVYEVGGSGVPNDHSDKEYDDKIIDRLGRVHERLEPLLSTMAESLPRMAGYAPGFQNALERAELGEIEWVSAVPIASFHTLWFELHEDLLCMLGRSRAE
jgi:pyruvate,orthophosphate dikinase